MRAVGVEDAVVPVGVENRSMSFAILLVGRLRIVCVDDSKKIRKEVDEHAALYEATPLQRKAPVRAIVPRHRARELPPG